MNDFEKYCRNRIKYGLFRFIFLLLVAIIVFFLSSKFNLFSDKVYALETTTIYRNSTFSNTGFLYTTSSSLTGTIYNGSVNTVIADASYGITFFLNKGTVAGKVYKIRVNFNDYDYLKSNNHNKVTITNGEECAVVGFQLINQGGSNNQAKGVDITYTCLSAGSYTGVQLAYYNEDNSAYDRITTISWRINNAQWEQVDDNQAAEIIANATINTNNIINNNNENTQDIIAGQSSQADRIIQNQNDIAQQQEKNQQVCETTTYDISSIKDDDKYLTSSGSLSSQSGYGVSDYIDISNVNSINVLTIGANNVCYYNSSKTYISCFIPNSTGSVSPPTNASFMRITFNKSNNRPIIEIDACKNGNQAVNDSINDLKDTITDTNVDTSSLNNVAGWLPPGPVDSILTLPLTLFNSLLSALNLSCTTLSLPLPYVNKVLELPCLGSMLRQINGFWTWYETIGVMVAGVMLYNYLLALYKWVDDTLTMRENTMPGYYEDRWGGGA